MRLQSAPLPAKYIRIMNDPNDNWTDLTYRNLICTLLSVMQPDNTFLDSSFVKEGINQIQHTQPDSPKVWTITKSLLEGILEVDDLNDFEDEDNRLELVMSLLDMAVASGLVRHQLEKDMEKQKEIHKAMVDKIKQLKIGAFIRPNFSGRLEADTTSRLGRTKNSFTKGPRAGKGRGTPSAGRALFQCSERTQKTSCPRGAGCMVGPNPPGTLHLLICAPLGLNRASWPAALLHWAWTRRATSTITLSSAKKMRRIGANGSLSSAVQISPILQVICPNSMRQSCQLKTTTTT